MKRLAVYSVEVGKKGDFAGFDVVASPEMDVILFSDDPSLAGDGYELRPLDLLGLDPARCSRRPKLMPHKYLPDYEWSLYVDCNIRLLCNPLDLLDTYKDRGDFVAFRHSDRQCVYQEAEHLIGLDYDDERRIREQMDHYRSLGFPSQNGLIAGCMLLRRHNQPRIKELGELWYEHVLRYSKRDQLSFPFASWTLGVIPSHFAGNVRENPYMQWPRRPRRERVTADFDPAIYAWLNPSVDAAGMSPQEHFLQARRAGNSTVKYKRHSWSLRKLANAHKSDKGDIYYNAHGYADVYETILQHLRDRPIKILEIGLLRHDVQAKNPGGPYDDTPSLSMWRQYFPKAEIFGFDIADFSTAPRADGVHILRGDASNPLDLGKLVETIGTDIDVIIDDASHASHHQQIALSALYAHLKPGGFYFIEDLHYQPPGIEQADAVVTAKVIAGLMRGKVRPTPHLDAGFLQSLLADMEWIRTYDSLDRSRGRINRDALAVIRKKEAAPG